MKQFKRIQGLLIFSLFFSTVLAASASFSGPTGLVTIPTAEAVKYREIEIAYDYALAKDPLDDLWRYRCNLGIFKSVEVGVVGGNEPKEGMFLNIKYYLTATEERLPLSLALGLKNLSSKNQSSFYMVASKKLRQDLNAHFGFEALFTETAVTPVMMGGFDYMIDENLKIMSDVNADEKDYFVNAAVEYYITRSLTLRAGALDLTSNNPVQSRYIVGLSYRKFL